MKQASPHFKLDLTLEIGPNLSRALIAAASLAARLMVVAPFYLLPGSTPLP
ncbi:hypothetical protein OA2633_00325 [Oceanicaulis sp. HTCC2633]|uniref:hypothetical protein n=1 Tax=Oceanicaulis sp. HTCC2633 TaxID=314254 RepID=UPI0000669A6E|nr:hypothetical protein [Oceanicaulis sp. HTCC2633]EAP89192.1 hypothetical protein OA2633_00325 [Oceanicaulis sp. HTCC2633]